MAKKRFNAAASKNSELLKAITFARVLVERPATFAETIPAFNTISDACKMLEKRLGLRSKGIDGPFGDKLAKDKVTHPVITDVEAKKASLHSVQNAAVAFGYLDALLVVNKKNRFIFARMSDKQRLRICKKAKESLERAAILELRALRVPKNTAPAQNLNPPGK